jgi:predicted ester cyclase
LTGTHKGTFAGVPATNKKAHWQSCNVIEVKSGKAISSRVYADNVSLMRQLGVLPVPKAAAG